MMALCVFLTCFSVREVIPKISLVPRIKKTMGQWQASVSFTVLNEHKEIIKIYLFAVTQSRQLPIAFLSWNIKKNARFYDFSPTLSCTDTKKSQHRVSKMAQQNDGSVAKPGDSINTIDRGNQQLSLVL